MLGEQIIESKGRTTGRRVVEGDRGPLVETSVEAEGTVLGIAGRITGTFVGRPQPGGTLACVGRGVFVGASGEMATFEAQAIGRPAPDGSVKMRGSLLFAPQHEGLARLARALVVFEEDVAPDGSTSKRAWEWL